MPHILIGILIFILSLFISWIIASVPVWLSAKLFSSKASLGKALIATFVGLLIFLILDRLISPFSHLIALLVGFVGILWIFKIVFDVAGSSL
ncbi:hypothetical protein [Metallosphaera hakonensis]|uniref:hypothetical protein n=1 Tax=Metallosphaera hakonensis TaxID=79601 RepID=UPI000ABCEB1D|nr:hypothetical protein [Metallosphaera hakonensis]